MYVNYFENFDFILHYFNQYKIQISSRKYKYIESSNDWNSQSISGKYFIRICKCYIIIESYLYIDTDIETSVHFTRSTQLFESFVSRYLYNSSLLIVIHMRQSLTMLVYDTHVCTWYSCSLSVRKIHEVHER